MVPKKGTNKTIITHIILSLFLNSFFKILISAKIGKKSNINVTNIIIICQGPIAKLNVRCRKIKF
jgi:hypothetical protein